jgi:hypothetical protein
MSCVPPRARRCLPLYHGQRDGARRLGLRTGIREKALEDLIANEQAAI